jgi:hypothetical protein
VYGPCDACAQGSHVAFERVPSPRPFGLPALEALQTAPVCTSESPSSAARCPGEIGSLSSEHLLHVFRDREQVHRSGGSNDLSKKTSEPFLPCGATRGESYLVQPQSRRVRLSALPSSASSTSALLQPRLQRQSPQQSKTLAEYFEEGLMKKLQKEHPDGGYGGAIPVSTESPQRTSMSRRYSVDRRTARHLEAISLREPCEGTPSPAASGSVEDPKPTHNKRDWSSEGESMARVREAAAELNSRWSKASTNLLHAWDLRDLQGDTQEMALEIEKFPGARGAARGGGVGGRVCTVNLL